MTACVTALNVYPVKSCAGTPLVEARLGPRGIEHDREFMLVDPSGRFLTQREVPRMALVRPARHNQCARRIQYIDQRSMP